MKTLEVDDLLQCVDGRLVQGRKDQKVFRATARPADIRSHTVYFHLRKKKYEAFDWASLRLRGAVIITDLPELFMKHADQQTAIIEVNDRRKAYWSFIRYYRGLFDIPIIGITGTSGKTTTTEMIRHMLSGSVEVSSTRVGRNALANSFKYLMSIDDRKGAAVFELGVIRPGNIATSCAYFKPTIGVILNIGAYHLQFCKTLDNYIKAKAEIVEGIAEGGTLIINAEDENIKKISLDSFKGRLVTFGFSERADFWAEQPAYTDRGMEFLLRFRDEAYRVAVPGFGTHTVSNAVAAIAAVYSAGIGIREAAERLSAFRQIKQHLQFRNGPGGCVMIDDTWNCTPLSMQAALEVLKATGGIRTKVALLGLMPQLGEEATGEYDRMGRIAVELGIDRIILLGEAKAIGESALQLGMNPEHVVFCETADEVFEALRPHFHPDALILLKIPYKYVYIYRSPFRKLMSALFT
ncbi:Mur ligase family protein [Paenibacillus thermotolerans]|uniref:Mur ligase family protein n=1 Tax=Paenibacillus thermotolerans TaxID=3027807 RepID=UPI0023679407|nr:MULTISPECIES: Mur ligase family protein [unclassified Paenibacillus]